MGLLWAVGAAIFLSYRATTFLSKADVLFYIIYSKVINKTDSEKEGRNTYMTETQNIILIHIDLLY